MLELKNITKIYRSKKGPKTTALNDVTLKFGTEGIVFILGKSGSGKSTLLNIIGGLDTPDSGYVIINGKSSSDFKPSTFDSYRNTYLGIVFQEFNVINDFNVYQNVELSLKLQNKKNNRNKILDTLKNVGLNNLENRSMNELSGGQKQRVAIARAIVKNPSIILADEPTGNLDSQTSAQVFSILKEISKTKLVIIVSHDVQSAKKYADRIIVFSDGVVSDDITNRANISENNTQSFNLIKSKLPFIDSFKFGFRTLKNIKIRLFMTTTLISATIIFLVISNLFSSLNINNAYARLMIKENEKNILLNKYNTNSDEDQTKTDFSEQDIEKIYTKIDESKVKPSYKINYEGKRITLGELGLIFSQQNSYYYSLAPFIVDFDFIEFDDDSNSIEENIIGRLPRDFNEILISNYMADQILKYGLNLLNEKPNNLGVYPVYKPVSYEEIITNQKILPLSIYGNVKIVGIIDYDLSKFNTIKNHYFESQNEMMTDTKYLALYENLGNNIKTIYNQVFVKKGFIKNLDLKDTNNLSIGYAYFKLDSKEYTFHKQAYLNDTITIYDGNEYINISNLDGNKIIINENLLGNLTNNNYYELLSDYLSKNSGDEKSLIKHFFEEYVKNYNLIGKKINLKWVKNHFNEHDANGEYEIIGIMYNENFENNEQIVYFSEESVKPFATKTARIFDIHIKEDNVDLLEDIFNVYSKENFIRSTTRFTHYINTAELSTTALRSISTYASIIFLIFSVLLLINFIYSSINYRKRDIGILRAIGARKMDVIIIFIWETILIMLISLILSSIGIIFATGFLNNYIALETSKLSNIYLINFRPFVLSGNHFFALSFMVIVLMLITSIIPISKITKMKPIDAILNK